MAAPAEASDKWAVPNAKIRYRLTIEERPKVPECGIFVQLPDGGILGGKLPVTTVIAADGRPLQSRLMWHSVEQGFCLIFEDPGHTVRTVDVYVPETGKPEYWTPESTLRPGTILCTLPGVDSVSAAESLAKFSPLPKGMTITPHQGIPRAVLSVGGDLLGRPAPWSFYLMGNVMAKQAGEFWFSPAMQKASSLTLVNGKEITPSLQMPGWGGTGAFVPLQAGLNRIEVFLGAPEPSDWLYYLAWAPPYEQFKKPVQNARGIVGADVARSGSARLTAVANRDSLPVACGFARPDILFWLENEPPVVIFTFSAFTEGNDPDTKYTWIFPDKGSAEGPGTSWLFPAFEDSSVTLVAKSAKGMSKTVIPFFATSTTPANLNLPTHNRLFREALIRMLRGYPAQSDPVQEWNVGFWNNLFRTMDFTQSRDLLVPLFEKHSLSLAKQLRPDQILWLQNILLTQLENTDPAEASKWIEFFKVNFKTPETAQKLKLREAELAIYAAGDFDKAQAILNPMTGKGSELAAKAKIRLGDIEFLKGNLNGATAFYSQAQAAAKASRNAPEGSTGDLAFNEALMKSEPKTAAPAPSATPRVSFTEKIQQRNEARDSAKGLAKSGALQDVSFSENVASLLEGNYMLEASKALELWEEEFPLSKVSGDYILREAQWNAKAGNHRRAVALLSAYCSQIDASSFLPRAVSQLIEYSDKVPDAKPNTRKVVEGVLNRMKFHPVAAQLEEYLNKP